MANTKNHQSDQNGFAHQTNHQKHQQTHGDVRQDNNAFPRERTASQQPASVEKPMRTRRLNTSSHHSQNKTVPKRRTVCVSFWIKPIVKAELQRIAEREGVSVSQAGGAFLENALQQTIDMQYGAAPSLVTEQP